MAARRRNPNGGEKCARAVYKNGTYSSDNGAAPSSCPGAFTWYTQKFDMSVRISL